jgi:hypothetical protein
MLTTLAIITALCAVAVIYPYVLYPIVLAMAPKRPVHRGPVKDENGAKFSLLFCAYNEAKVMPQKIENIRALKAKYPLLEVLVFDDGSADGTADLIEREAPFVRVVRGGGRNGKAHGMKLLAAMARGQYLVFTDANVLLHEDALLFLAICYENKDVGGVCGALHYLGADGSSTAAVGGMYCADGSIFSTRRELYPEFPDTVLDDFTVSMEVVFRGFRLIKCNDVIAYEQLVSARSDEFRRKVRISARAFHTHTVLARKRKALSSLDRFKYASHKTLRWFGGGFLVLGAATALTAVVLIQPVLGAVAAAAIAIVFALGCRSSAGSISALVEITLALVATLIGVVRAIRGQTFAVWNPAKSRSI